jgi:hypothetical protein
MNHEIMQLLGLFVMVIVLLPVMGVLTKFGVVLFQILAAPSYWGFHYAENALPCPAIFRINRYARGTRRFLMDFFAALIRGPCLRRGRGRMPHGLWVDGISIFQAMCSLA